MVNIFSLKTQGQNNKKSFIQIYLLNELSNIKSKGIEISPQNMINISHLLKEMKIKTVNAICHCCKVSGDQTLSDLTNGCLATYQLFTTSLEITQLKFQS